VEHGHRIYSIELQEIKKPRSKGSILKEHTTTEASKESIAQNLDKVKKNTSKIVDENGEPKVVFHGARTLDDFDVFNGRGSNGKIFFTDNIDVAKMFYGRLTELQIINKSSKNLGLRITRQEEMGEFFKSMNMNHQSNY